MHCEVKKGDIVTYVHKVDTDTTETPNTSAAFVTKANEETFSVDLIAFFPGGHVHVFNVQRDLVDKTARGTWHWR